MTEDEAKTKWCPMMRDRIELAPDAWGDIDRHVLNDAREEGRGHNCIGSACMMWRWYGYCGLAGKP